MVDYSHRLARQYTQLNGLLLAPFIQTILHVLRCLPLHKIQPNSVNRSEHLRFGHLVRHFSQNIVRISQYRMCAGAGAKGRPLCV